MPNKNTQWQYFEHQIFPNSDSVIIYFLVVYFSHIQNCIQLVITHLTSYNMQMNSPPWTREFQSETC